MAMFKRKASTIDLTDHGTTPCPRCGGASSTDYVDLVKRLAVHTCRRCTRLFETRLAGRVTA